MQAKLTNWVDQSPDSVYGNTCLNPDGPASEASRAQHRVWFHPAFLTHGSLKAWVAMLVGSGILCEAGTGSLIWSKFNNQVSVTFSLLFIQVYAAAADNLIF